MIDRQARDGFAFLLRRLASGRIHTDDFFNEAPDRSDDPAIPALFNEVWDAFYTDYGPDRFVGRKSLSRTTRRQIAQLVLFLHSDIEYSWPPRPEAHPMRALANAFTFGLIGLGIDEESKTWKAQGDYDAYPFRRSRELVQATRSPRFLSGTEHRRQN